MPDTELIHPHSDVLGVKVSAIDLEMAVELAGRSIGTGSHGYVCLTGVHGVMEAQHDPELRRILNRATINAPDGMPMTWIGRHQGFSKMDRVFGPDFMALMCRVSVLRGYRHFLYGGKEGVADLLSEKLRSRFPGIQIVDTYTPPFGALSFQDETQILARVRDSAPDIVWVGLSTPRQERFMAQYVDRIQAPLMVGVGAAFDFHTGTIRDCPDWIKRAGLQWFHRLLQDPGRLWKRYLRNNPAFLWNIACQLTGLRSYPSDVEMPESGLPNQEKIRH
jgi:N-acetylglucosaminyldiphosphoundecaprenol N-acetyl-beta-D-mannosaminyltransferase